MTEEEAARYSADDLPPPKNVLVYAYRCFAKVFATVFFGVGSLVLGLVVFTILRIFVHPHERFKKAARAVVSATFRFFLTLLRLLGIFRLEVHDKQAFRALRSTVIVANHPSLLDVVIIISLVPNTDCIVNGGLSKTVVKFVIKQLYIVNTLGYEEMVELSQKSLTSGANLIVFPEGTRTPRHGTNPYKRGAARIAVSCKCGIQPVYIGGNDKYGLGKHDPLFSYNKTERYRYDVRPLPRINIEEYLAQEPQIATRRLTEKMHQVIAEEAKARDGKDV